jgi:hypothetical protein
VVILPTHPQLRMIVATLVRTFDAEVSTVLVVDVAPGCAEPAE